MGRRARLKKFRKDFAEALRRQSERPPLQRLEEAVVAWLTGGSIPIDHCFLAHDTFCIWSPERGELLLMKVFDGDPSLHEACRDYLRQRGAAFGTIDEVNAEVRRRGLPGATRAEPCATADRPRE